MVVKKDLENHQRIHFKCGTGTDENVQTCKKYPSRDTVPLNCCNQSVHMKKFIKKIDVARM
jgi:hypothetical protein